MRAALLGVRPDAARATTAHPGEPTRSRPDARKLPRWLRRALLPDPAKRWPDMHALISACERRRHSVPGRILLASLTTLTLALAAGLALHTCTNPRPPRRPSTAPSGPPPPRSRRPSPSSSPRPATPAEVDAWIAAHRI